MKSGVLVSVIVILLLNVGCSTIPKLETDIVPDERIKVLESENLKLSESIDSILIENNEINNSYKEELNKAKAEIADIKDENEKLNGLVQSFREALRNADDGNTDTTEYQEYFSHKWTSCIGFYRYTSDLMPRIYPDEKAPRISKEHLFISQMDEIIVEIIMHTNRGFYLVRIPFAENYVYVKEDEIEKVSLDDYPFLGAADEGLNGYSIGDNARDLISTFEGVSFAAVEYGYGRYYNLYDEQEVYTPFDSVATITVDMFDRIKSLAVTTGQFKLNSGYSVGSNANECFSHYDSTYARIDKSKYSYSLSESYFLSFEIDSDELNKDSVISRIVITIK